MSEQIKSFEDWYKADGKCTPIGEEGKSIPCQEIDLVRWEREAWEAACKMKDEEIEKLMILQTELEAKNYDLQKENEALKNQIEKMKCCGNCQRRYDGACYEYDNLCEKWSLAK